MRKDSTLSYFDQRRPDAVERLLPIVPTAPNRSPIKQMSWSRQEGPTSWDEVATTIATSSLPDAVFFLDSSFLHRHEIPGKVFDALLSRRIAITPLVWGELQDWLNSPFANVRFRDVLASAKTDGSSSIIFVDPSDFPDNIRASVSYYVSLLIARKSIGIFLREQYALNRGRVPTADELVSLLQSRVGDRGTVLARKGLEDHVKPNFATDEDLVVAAIVYGLLTGHETSILTRDRDPLEQFRKFLYLLDTDYRSGLIAESFRDTPDNLIFTSTEVETSQDFFEAGKRIVLDLPRRFTDWVIRTVADSVVVACMRLAGPDDRMKMASLQFCARRDMAQVLEIKGPSGGRNSDLPDKQNCHLAISPPFIRELGGNAIIGHDRIVEVGPFKGPLVDIEYSLQEVQRFRQTIVDASAPMVDGGTPGMKLADFYLPMRLAFSSEPGWQDLEWSELAKAIRFFDAASLFYVDRDVLGNCPADVRRALLERGFCWSRAIRESTCVPEFQGRITSDESKQLADVHEFELSSRTTNDYGFAHYRTLLALRRQIATIIRTRVRAEQGRECEAGEVETIAEYYGGIRARRLARQGEDALTDPLWFAGDELLVYGAIAGVLEGTDVVFITRDPLFMDQFVKLCCLLGSDFVACEFGRRHSDAVASFQSSLLEANSANDVVRTFGPSIVSKLPPGWRRDILPRSPYLLNLHCWLLGRDDGNSLRFAAWTYCAERGMHNLLRIKGETGGRSVEYDDINLRASFDGRDDGDATVIACKDRMISIGKADFPRDGRITCCLTSVAATDITRLQMNPEPMVLPWHELSPRESSS